MDYFGDKIAVQTMTKIIILL